MKPNLDSVAYQLGFDTFYDNFDLLNNEDDGEQIIQVVRDAYETIGITNENHDNPEHAQEVCDFSRGLDHAFVVKKTDKLKNILMNCTDKQIKIFFNSIGTLFELFGVEDV